MKKSKFERYLDKSNWKCQYFGQKEAWNAACKSILRKAKKLRSGFSVNPEIDNLIEEIQEIIEKKNTIKSAKPHERSEL